MSELLPSLASQNVAYDLFAIKILKKLFSISIFFSTKAPQIRKIHDLFYVCFQYAYINVIVFSLPFSIEAERETFNRNNREIMGYSFIT